MLFKTFLLGCTLTFSVSAIAEVKLTEADLLGAWQVDSESINADGSNAKALSTVWTFQKDGRMEGYSTDSNQHARISELRSSLQYSLEDGKIVKQVSPGRSKMETCIAVAKEGAKMTLQCNRLYFFMTKK